MTWLVLTVALGALLVAVGIGWWWSRARGTGPGGAAIDPFALSEPWRRSVGAAQRSQHRAHRAVRRVRPGPLRDRLVSITGQLDHAIAAVWEVARRGDEIDRTLRRRDPTTLRSRLSTFGEQARAEPSPELDAAIASVERELETAARLRVMSNHAAIRLGLATTRIDELVARAEVGIDLADTERYESDVDALIDQLESVRLALDETRTDGL